MKPDNDLPPALPHDPYAALRHRDFRLWVVGRFVTAFGGQMLSVAIGWELWLRTHDALALGLIGLVQVIPIILLALPGGYVADQFERRRIVTITQVLLAICSLGLTALSWVQGPLPLIYLCLLGIGIARAFFEPAAATVLPQTVPPEDFTNAATWNSSTWQAAAILGPAAAGLIAAWLDSVTIIYLLDAAAGLIFLAMVALIRGRPLALSRRAATLESLAEGLHFIRTNPVILAAITLDMFAVLFGGAVTLMPVFATDILDVGPLGLGIMRAAPSVGALVTIFMLAHLPPFKRAGRTLLLAVAGFGLATIVFGLSRSFGLSLLMLGLLGGFDNVSVVIRSTLILTRTPDEMRGRTSAINSIFIGASNELGGFESGVAARLLGPIVAVVAGGIGTILVVAATGKIWPQLAGMKSLDGSDEAIPPSLANGSRSAAD